MGAQGWDAGLDEFAWSVGTGGGAFGILALVGILAFGWMILSNDRAWFYLAVLMNLTPIALVPAAIAFALDLGTVPSALIGGGAAVFAYRRVFRERD